MNKKYHPFHLVDKSPWPFVLSNSIFSLMMGMILFLHYNMNMIMLIGLFFTMSSLMLWFSDIMSESTFIGLHTTYVTSGLKIGMILFIISEMCFFSSFFWAFFHSSLSPSIDMSFNWPPEHIMVLDLYHHPIVNTSLLLFSALTVTMCHHNMINGNSEYSLDTIISTMMLGMLFLFMQYMEYKSSFFCFSDGMYGSTFFMLTGFHGFHVMVGMMFLWISLYSISDYHFSKHHHFGFEASVWYWHFVDVVWLFLVMCIYWWGS